MMLTMKITYMNTKLLNYCIKKEYEHVKAISRRKVFEPTAKFMVCTLGIGQPVNSLEDMSEVKQSNEKFVDRRNMIKFL